MRRVIDGSLYDTNTARLICEQQLEENRYDKGAPVKQLKQLYRTRSAKFFFYVRLEYVALVDVNNDDLNFKLEEKEVRDENIVPATYDLALQFASEVYEETKDPKQKENIERYFAEFTDKEDASARKIQKKIYISEKADRYLEEMLKQNEDTNSSFIESLIVKEYERQYQNFLVHRNPYDEFTRPEDSV